MVDRAIVKNISLLNDKSDLIEFTNQNNPADVDNYSLKDFSIVKLTINCKFLIGFEMDVTIDFGKIEFLIEAIIYNKDEIQQECDFGIHYSCYGYKNGIMFIQNHVKNSNGDASINIKIPVNFIDKNSLELLRTIIKKLN